MAIADRDLFDGYLEAWNAHDPEAVARYMADDAIYEDVALGRVLHGPSEIAAFVEEATRASSDFRFEEVSLFTAGRDYANEWIMGEPTGDYQLVPATHIDTIKTLLRFARSADSAQRMRVVRALLDSLDVNAVGPEEWLQIFESGSEGIRRTIAVSARLAEYKRVRAEIATLVEKSDVGEQELQHVLEQHPWLFGSEYSELLVRRNWTRDDRLDFMLRRTADDYLEIVEIKTPMRQSLFRYDPSHDSYAPSAPLSAAIGQVVRYIEEVERNRDAILAKDGCDTLKIRARLIIGMDGDEKQKGALRSFNGHLHRIEVLTFDQLLRIADRVVSIFEEKLALARQ